MEIHQLSAIREGGKAFVEFLRTANVSAGVYRFPSGGKDMQAPHAEEEVYYVVSGCAHFASGSNDVAVKAGDVLFVTAKKPHRVHDIQEDLELLVYFAPAEGTL